MADTYLISVPAEDAALKAIIENLKNKRELSSTVVALLKDSKALGLDGRMDVGLERKCEFCDRKAQWEINEPETNRKFYNKDKAYLCLSCMAAVNHFVDMLPSEEKAVI